MMQQIENPTALTAARRALQGSVGFVPTMGALHAGHLALIETARRENDHVVVSIFVNPTQFGVGEDYSTYPRQISQDLALLAKCDVDYVFTPSVDHIYPQRFQTNVDVELLSMGLEGAARPGHFRGVSTVVLKLLNIVQPTHAYFGQKDAQQVLVIRQMVRDLNVPVEVVVCPTVREADGLAMSSRNRNLNPAERQAATVLFRALFAAAEAYDAGERQPNAFREIALRVLRSEPMAKVDYVAICNPRTLFGVHETLHEPVLMLLAARVGSVRLLDNALVPWSANQRDGLKMYMGVEA